MAMGVRTMVTMLVVLLVFGVGGVLLQIFLSRRESKWPGLVLPGITFLFSVLMVLNVAAVGDVQGVIVTMTGIILMGNIPTLILLAIYFACRGGRQKKDEIEKMNISDL